MGTERKYWTIPPLQKRGLVKPRSASNTSQAELTPLKEQIQVSMLHFVISQPTSHSLECYYISYYIIPLFHPKAVKPTALKKYTCIWFMATCYQSFSQSAGQMLRLSLALPLISFGGQQAKQPPITCVLGRVTEAKKFSFMDAQGDVQPKINATFFLHSPSSLLALVEKDSPLPTVKVREWGWGKKKICSIAALHHL